MKYLCGSTEMHELLQQWSGTEPLIFANFYFWYPGKAIQKSLNGLLRGLLYQIFTARLDLAPIAFPSYYDDIIPLKPLLGQSLSDGELLQALENIAQHDGNDTKCTKFCFFIDGLDEYSGDHLGLVRVLHRLAKNPDFKLCVSSRPWNAFRNAFETSVPNLQLENLTHDDIQHYVRESLREAYASVSFATEEALNDLDFTDDTEALIEDIVKGAEGVFLWVYLVVRSVIRGIAEGDDIDFLRHRVQSFPSDLDEFFRNILVRVDAEYKAQSSQALYLAYLGVSASWIDFWLIRQSPSGLSSPEFAYELAIEGLSLQRLEKRVNETRTFLSAVCKDLLWLPKHNVQDHFPIPFHKRVVFLHRSVYDFLKAENIQAMLKDQVPDHFKNGKITHQLNLARLKLAMLSAYGPSIQTYLERTARPSLTEAHPALSKKFVQAFEEVFSRYYATNKEFVHNAELLAAFVAFDCSRYIQLMLTNSMKKDTSDLACQPVLAAAIGQSPLNRFPLDEASLHLIKYILDAVQRQMARKYGTQTAVSRDSCSLAVWPKLLAKLALEVSKTSNSKLSRHAWLVTKYFLQQFASMDESLPLLYKFCSNPRPCSEGYHEHQWERADLFLIRHVPLRWREELKDTTVYRWLGDEMEEDDPRFWNAIVNGT